MPEITVHYCNDTKIVKADKEVSLLEVLHKNGFFVESPCNGNGTCAKCRVIVNSSNLSFTREETEVLSEAERMKGVHLSCRLKVTEDMEITLFEKIKGASILTDIRTEQISGDGIIKKYAIKVEEPSIYDQRPDDERVLHRINMLTKAPNESCSETLKSQLKKIPLPVLKELPYIIRQNSYQVTLIEMLSEITGVEGGNTEKKLYGVAVDIGTTTIAAYLFDLNDKKLIAVESMLNPQKKYGADVISRIDYASKSIDNANEITNTIRDALQNVIKKLIYSTGHSLSDIYLTAVVGNTTMIHILLGLPCFNIAVSPFIPVTRYQRILHPEEIGLEINKYGRVLVLPSVSAYIGSDTVAAVLSSGIHLAKDITLIVDIGTNGEIVLGNENEMYACSTAAGPAFEGANILCGTGGIEGAISEVSIINDGELEIKTIGGYKPIGICGSGIVDAVSCMLTIGVVDETGRILDKDELPQDALNFEDRLVKVNGQSAFVLADANATMYGDQIIITQQDIREIQNAKAAIAAGIRVLAKEAGYNIQSIKKVYLAGGFGNFMRIESAVNIGLLPKELKNRVYTIGNAAGSGAAFSLLSEKEYSAACLISGKIKCVELSANPDFVSEYTENMLFDTF